MLYGVHDDNTASFGRRRLFKMKADDEGCFRRPEAFYLRQAERARAICRRAATSKGR